MFRVITHKTAAKITFFSEMAKKNRHKIVKGDKFPRIANYVLQIVLRMLIKPCKFLFSKTHEMVKYTPTNYALCT